MSVIDRAKLYQAAFAGILLLSAVSCLASESASEFVPAPVYDRYTSVLVRLDWDSDRDGRIDQRTYVTGATPWRSECDTDGDGRIDRWEYVTSSGQVARIGSSSANDGVEDTWMFPEDAAGEARVDRSRYRDRVVDRREYYRADSLVRADEDANRDGHADKWETWEGGRLRVAAFDTTFSGRSPDRRLIYDDRGRFAYMETDTAGDGRFERLATPALPTEREDLRD